MKLRKFNESIEEKNIWCVIVFDSGGFVDDEKSKSFSTRLLAADYFIKYINDYYEQDFEPFYEDGERLFLNVEDNADFDACLDFIQDEIAYTPDIFEVPFLTKPEY